MEKLDLVSIMSTYASTCGSHDMGLTEFGCSCPSGDPRHIIVTMVQHLGKLYDNYDLLLCSTQNEAIENRDTLLRLLDNARPLIIFLGQNIESQFKRRWLQDYERFRYGTTNS